MADEPTPDKKPSRVDTKALLRFYEALKTKRTPWETLWQDIAMYIVPRKYPGMNGTVLCPTTENESRLFDTTAIQAHQINAAGCLAWMTPENSPWFSFSAPIRVKDEGVKRWLAKGTQTGFELIGQSPFYLAAHEFYLDRSGFGTACIYCERAEDGKLHFECWELGTFVIAEDHRKQVNTVIRAFKLTATQAEEKFGKDNLPKKIRECLEKGGEKALEEFDFRHFVMPRPKKQQEGTPQESMPIACYYVAVEGAHLCRESGYQIMPCMVSRYLEWGTGSGGLYGWAPSFSALPEARQVNFMQKMMDTLAEKIAFPPWIAPAGLEGEIDVSPAGVTYVSEDIDVTKLKEMPVVGRYDVGMARVQERQKAINSAFNVDMFQMLTSMDKPRQMTAREIAERASEKLIPFSPTFSRIKNEFTNPMLQWLFNEMLMAQDFGPWEEIPQGLAIEQQNGLFIIPPTIRYNSRMEMAMQQLPTLALYNTVELCMAISQGKGLPPFDNFDWDKGVRDAAVGYGMDADIIKPMTKVDEVREQQAEAQQAMEQQQQAMAGADAAAKLGSVKQDSLVGKALEDAA